MKVEVTPVGTSKKYNTVIEPAILEGDNLRLVPMLATADAEKLYAVYSQSPQVFKYFPDGPSDTLEEFKALYQSFDDDITRLTFLVYDKNSTPEPIIGSVQFLDLYPSHKRNEIGSIWITPSMHGTYALLEINLLLMSYSFEDLKFKRVQWKTHHENIASQKAALKLGFKYEATFKNHIIMYDGTTRHSLYYSVVDEDWPTVKEGLEARIQQRKQQ
jgi:RimJ/RimL family protein N-acetyltransferase